MDRLEVVLDIEATSDEVAAVEAAFRDAGFDADAKADYVRRGRELYPWLVSVTVPLGLFLKRFLELAAEDAWVALKRLVTQVREARKASLAPPGSVLIVDKRTHETIVLLGNEPDEAFQQLPTLDIKQTDSGQLYWDDKVGQWVDAWELSDQQ
jgi:hypothetical protein